MSPAGQLAGSLLGLGLGVGVVASYAAARGYRPGTPRLVAAARAAGPGPARRWSAGIALGVVLVIVTGWVALALGVAVLVGFWPALFGARTQLTTQIATLEALAAWTESLRDEITTHAGLPDALMSTTAHPPQALAGPLGAFAGRVAHHEPMTSALRRLAQDIDDPVADHTVAALILAANVQGSQLTDVLAALAWDTRRRVADRRAATVDYRGKQRNTRLIVLATLVMVTFIAVLLPEWAAEYRTPTGQVVLFVAAGFFAAGFVVLARLSRWVQSARFVFPREQVPR